MEIGDRKMLLTPLELYLAQSGADASGDEELAAYLDIRLTALDLAAGTIDPSKASKDYDIDSSDTIIDWERANELDSSHAAIVEIPFRDVALVERIAAAIVAGHKEEDTVTELVDKLDARSDVLKAIQSTMEQWVEARNKRRQALRIQNSHLHVVPPIPET
jgi:hypothetical protein